MGSAQSSQQREEDGVEDDEEEEEEEVDLVEEEEESRVPSKLSIKKILEQEPEILACHASASPISPQLSTAGTPRLLSSSVSSIKVWDPCNVLGPPPPPSFSRSFVAGEGYEDGSWDRVTEVILIGHGECGAGTRPDLVGGRWPDAMLTVKGERQGRALAVFLNSQGVRFNAVYTSPLERARATAALVCQELEFPVEQIQFSEALNEINNGQWEGCYRSEIYTPEMISLMDRTQPDFAAPSGESLRQVEFRMIEFLNKAVIKMPENISKLTMSMHQNERKGFSCHSSTDFARDENGPIPPQWDLFHRNNKQQVFTKKKSGKSRLRFVTTGDHETEDEFSPRETDNLHEVNMRKHASVGIFTHATPIKCLLTGLLECNPSMSTKICIYDSSVTVLEHKLGTGWRVKRLNDTAHLRLL